jgi:hypothetical protein
LFFLDISDFQVRLDDGTCLYRGGVDCLVKILKHEGPRGLFHGLSANLLRGVGGTLLLVGYDEAKAWLQ